MDGEKELTAVEAAEVFNVTSRSIRKWIHKGFFPNARRIGPTQTSPYRIPESDIKALKKQLFVYPKE